MAQWYNQDIARVKKMAKQGILTVDIASAVGRTPSAVRSLLRRFGIPPNNPATYFSEDEDQNLANMYDGGSSVIEIARELGRTRNSIIGRINRLRIKGLVTRKDEPKGRKVLAPNRKKERKTEKKVVRIPVLDKAEPEKSDAWIALPGSNPVPVHLHKDGCTWPIGDGPILYCNNPSHGKMWCPEHMAMGFRKNSAPGAEKGTLNRGLSRPRTGDGGGEMRG